MKRRALADELPGWLVRPKWGDWLLIEERDHPDAELHGFIRFLRAAGTWCDANGFDARESGSLSVFDADQVSPKGDRPPLDLVAAVIAERPSKVAS